MARKHDDILDTTYDSGNEQSLDPLAELTAVMDDLEALLKSGEVVSALTSRGINASIAALAAAGLHSYLQGRKAEASDDLGTAAEEIRGRIAVAGKPS